MLQNWLQPLCATSCMRSWPPDTQLGDWWDICRWRHYHSVHCARRMPSLVTTDHFARQPSQWWDCAHTFCLLLERLQSAKSVLQVCSWLSSGVLTCSRCARACVSGFCAHYVCVCVCMCVRARVRLVGTLRRVINIKRTLSSQCCE